jgi:hypothetical protein
MTKRELIETIKKKGGVKNNLTVKRIARSHQLRPVPDDTEITPKLVEEWAAFDGLSSVEFPALSDSDLRLIEREIGVFRINVQHVTVGKGFKGKVNVRTVTADTEVLDSKALLAQREQWFLREIEQLLDRYLMLADTDLVKRIRMAIGKKATATK